MLDFEDVPADSLHSRQIRKFYILDQRTQHNLSIDVFFFSRALIRFKLSLKLAECLVLEEQVVAKFYSYWMPRNAKVVELAAQGDDMPFFVVAVDIPVSPAVVL
jgi:hypothetical protein